MEHSINSEESKCDCLVNSWYVGLWEYWLKKELFTPLTPLLISSEAAQRCSVKEVFLKIL